MFPIQAPKTDKKMTPILGIGAIKKSETDLNPTYITPHKHIRPLSMANLNASIMPLNIANQSAIKLMQLDLLKDDKLKFLQPSQTNSQRNHFEKLSDEIILNIFKFLPQKDLLNCGIVCQSFNRIAADKCLWPRVNLGRRTLRSGALENIMKRGVIICRLSQSVIPQPIYEQQFIDNRSSYECKLQYLDLSMAQLTITTLHVLLAPCRQLKKLSLENIKLNEYICSEISKNVNLEELNLAMCSGFNVSSIYKMFNKLEKLSSLNISWAHLTTDELYAFVLQITPNLKRLNIAGCREKMLDIHLVTLSERCTELVELDVSDCISLTGNAINIICNFKMLEQLSLSRCYSIAETEYFQLNDLQNLKILNVFNLLSLPSLEILKEQFPNLAINQFIYNSVARPTVGQSRTTIWNLRTQN